MAFKVEDYAFWIFLLAALAIVLWFFHGSPTVEQALLSLTILIITSEFMLWKKYFEIDKRTALSFMRFGHDIKDIKVSLSSIEKILRCKK